MQKRLKITVGKRFNMAAEQQALQHEHECHGEQEIPGREMLSFIHHEGA